MSLKFNSDVIETFRTIVVTWSFVANENVSVNINNIEFVPDEVFLNAIAYFDNSNNPTLNTSLYTLYSTLVDNYALCSFPNYDTIGGMVKLDTPFKLGKIINGNYNFNLQSAYGGSLSATAFAQFNFNISLTLTFYKYKNVK